MNKITNLSVFWRKVIVYAALVCLAALMSFVLSANFKARIAKTDKEQFWEQMAVPELKQEVDQARRKFQEQTRELQEQLEQQLVQMATSTATMTPASTYDK